MLSWLLLVLLANRQTKGRAVEELAKIAAAAAQQRATDAHLRITRRLPSLQIAEETHGDMDQVQGVRTQNGPVSRLPYKCARKRNLSTILNEVQGVRTQMAL